MGLFDSMLDRGRSLGDGKKYLGDFEVTEEKDEKGRIRKKAYYTGAWTVMRRPRKDRYFLFAALALAVAAAGIYVRTLTLRHLSSGQYLVMVPLLIGLFPALYLLFGVCSLPFRGRPMRRDQYMHSFIRASRSAVAVAAFAAVSLAASLIHRIIKGDWSFMGEDWLFLSCCVGIAAFSLLIVTLLRRVDFTEKENSAYERRAL